MALNYKTPFSNAQANISDESIFHQRLTLGVLISPAYHNWLYIISYPEVTIGCMKPSKMLQDQHFSSPLTCGMIWINNSICNF